MNPDSLILLIVNFRMRNNHEGAVSGNFSSSHDGRFLPLGIQT